MPRFLVDENLPRSLAPALRNQGHSVEDVRDLGLRGRPDEEVFEAARSRGLTLLTRDRGFGHVLRFPQSDHAGIIVVRLPAEFTVQQVIEMILRAIQDIPEDRMTGRLIIVEPGRIRFRPR